MAGAELVLKPGAKKSPVWAYFRFEGNADSKPVDEDRSICKECTRTVATKAGNTSNLLSHLQNSHPAIYQRLKGGEGSLKSLKTRSTGRQQQL